MLPHGQNSIQPPRRWKRRGKPWPEQKPPLNVRLLVYSSEIDGVNTTVARIQGELGSAELDLSNTTVVAPTDGYVTQLFLRPGMVVNMSTPTMVFVHSDPNVLTATFDQNTLQRILVGNEAEIAFDGIPGRVFKGEVMQLVDAVSQGQVQASGTC